MRYIRRKGWICIETVEKPTELSQLEADNAYAALQECAWQY